MVSDKWQPIETAPKDGSELLFWSEREGGLYVVFWHGLRKSWLWTTHSLDGDEELKHATYWMPLPDPPKGDKGEP